MPLSKIFPLNNGTINSSLNILINNKIKIFFSDLMIKCPQCGTFEDDTKALYCENCGTKLPSSSLQLSENASNLSPQQDSVIDQPQNQTNNIIFLGAIIVIILISASFFMGAFFHSPIFGGHTRFFGNTQNCHFYK